MLCLINPVHCVKVLGRPFQTVSSVLCPVRVLGRPLQAVSNVLCAMSVSGRPFQSVSTVLGQISVLGILVLCSVFRFKLILIYKVKLAYWTERFNLFLIY